MGEPQRHEIERYVVSQAVMPVLIVDDEPVMRHMWEELAAKASEGITAERPTWRMTDREPSRDCHFFRLVKTDDGHIEVPCSKEDASIVYLILTVWAEPA